MKALAIWRRAMNCNEEEDKIDIVENKLRELREQINKMEKENAALFDDLGLAPHQLQDFLSDPTRYNKPAYEFIQRERQALEAVLERRISDVRASIRKENPPDNIRGHWIFVR
jgi:chromosome segregation ATPase